MACVPYAAVGHEPCTPASIHPPPTLPWPHSDNNARTRGTDNSGVRASALRHAYDNQGSHSGCPRVRQPACAPSGARVRARMRGALMDLRMSAGARAGGRRRRGPWTVEPGMAVSGWTSCSLSGTYGLRGGLKGLAMVHCPPHPACSSPHGQAQGYSLVIIPLSHIHVLSRVLPIDA